MTYDYSNDSEKNKKIAKNLLIRLEFLRVNGYLIAQIICTIVLPFPTHYFVSPSICLWNILLVIIILLLILIIAFCSFKKEKNYQLLLNENKALIQYQKKYESLNEDMTTSQQKQQETNSILIKMWLQAVLYGLSIDKPNYRVTIFNTFQDNKKNTSFRFLARYSNNKLYATPHVIHFQMDNGIISQTWEKGPTIDIKKCPIYKHDQNAYIEYIHRTYNLPKDRIESLTMKSDQYIGLRVSDTPDDVKGIIVFKSIAENNEKGLNETHVENITNFCKENALQLAFMLNLGLNTQSMIQSKEQQLEKEDVNKTELSLIQSEIGSER